jgi:hypothetical protein
MTYDEKLEIIKSLVYNFEAVSGQYIERNNITKRGVALLFDVDINLAPPFDFPVHPWDDLTDTYDNVIFVLTGVHNIINYWCETSLFPHKPESFGSIKFKDTDYRIKTADDVMEYIKTQIKE